MKLIKSDIKIAAKPVFYKQCHEEGVKKVKDLLDGSSDNLYLSTRFKEKVSFITYYGPLNAIKSKWKVPASQRPRAPRTQNWFDDAENLSTAAHHKIIVGNKFQPPSNDNKITRLGAA